MEYLLFYSVASTAITVWTGSDSSSPELPSEFSRCLNGIFCYFSMTVAAVARFESGRVCSASIMHEKKAWSATETVAFIDAYESSPCLWDVPQARTWFICMNFVCSRFVASELRQLNSKVIMSKAKRDIQTLLLQASEQDEMTEMYVIENAPQ